MSGTSVEMYQDRFWSKVSKLGEDDCWEWQGAKDTFGYGNFYNGKYVKAHRYSYELAHEPINNRYLYVCHTCDNPNCVNPKHLFLGTANDNVQDMISKGRKGNKKIRTVDPNLVATVRNEFSNGETNLHALARKHGLKTSYVFKLIHRLIWKDLDDL